MDWKELAQWGQPAIAAGIAVVLALIVHLVGRTVLRRVVRFMPILGAVERRVERPARVALPLIAVQVVWQGVSTDLPGLAGVQHITSVLIIAAITWCATAAVRGVAEAVIARYPVDVADNLHARRVHTQTRVLKRTADVVIVLAGIALILMTFPGARQFGTSLLASAGVLGLVGGLAARSVFSNLLAGWQIALAQPIRIDDVLIVNGEWGKVEEITATYVVLAIWDQRRLIIPLQWFIENPFENWTRRDAQIIGTVFLWVDYHTPLEPLRQAAQRACEASPDWDRRLCKLQVTEAGERAMQLRILVSAATSGQAWDLRCHVREALIDFLQREHPGALPKVRIEAGPLTAGSTATRPS